jgi:hypothetical protein
MKDRIIWTSNKGSFGNQYTILENESGKIELVASDNGLSATIATFRPVNPARSKSPTAQVDYGRTVTESLRNRLPASVITELRATINQWKY